MNNFFVKSVFKKVHMFLMIFFLKNDTFAPKHTKYVVDKLTF